VSSDYYDGWFAELDEPERCRLLNLAAKVLSEVIALDKGDQLDVLALVLRAWCHAWPVEAAARTG
jgi:hypothetical protein